MPELKHLNYQLELASERVDAQAVKALIPQTDPTFNNSIALRRAAEHGHADCVRLLIPVSDPKAENSYALCLASQEGHSDCVSLLIPVSDPKANNSLALFWAAEEGHADCVALLLPVSDPLALGLDGLTASDWARSHGRVDIAAMIDAFIEAKALSGSLPSHPVKSLPRASL